jgi:hypothetical protein
VCVCVCISTKRERERERKGVTDAVTTPHSQLTYTDHARTHTRTHNRTRTFIHPIHPSITQAYTRTRTRTRAHENPQSTMGSSCAACRDASRRADSSSMTETRLRDPTSGRGRRATHTTHPSQRHSAVCCCCCCAVATAGWLRSIRSGQMDDVSRPTRAGARAHTHIRTHAHGASLGGCVCV